jgi:fucose 4-O-acetylase-like acetyltransferase
MMSSGKRNDNIDFIRAVAILLVILGHNIQYGSGVDYLNSGACLDNPLFKFIYTFHMPLFAFLSGMVLNYSISRSTKSLIRSKFTSLLLPVISWSTLEYAVWLFQNGVPDSGITFLRKYAHRLLTSLWFFWAIFYCSIAVILIEKYVRRKKLIYFFLFVVLMFIPNQWNANYYIFLFPYYAAGYYLLKNKEAFSVSSRQKRVLFLGNVALFWILFAFFDRSTYIYTTGTFLLDDRHPVLQLCINMQRWITGFSAIAMIYPLLRGIFERTSRFKAAKILLLIGRNTSGFYIANNYYAHLLPFLPIALRPNFVYWMIELVIDLGISALAIRIISFSPVLSMLLLGKKWLIHKQKIMNYKGENEHEKF